MSTILYLILPIALLTFLAFRSYFLIPSVDGLPVLMYHNVDDTLPADAMNVTAKQFEEQLKYLNERNYTTISFSELLHFVEHNDPLPKNALMITVDDGYKNNFSVMYPLLEKYHVKANIFLVSNFIDSKMPGVDADAYLSTSDIQQMNPTVVQFGLHTYDHKNYKDLDQETIDADLKLCDAQLTGKGIQHYPCFAYTYGAYPKKDPAKKEQLFQLLRNNNVKLAFRIGNRINKFPFSNKLLIERIDIRGSDSLSDFGIKLKKGRLKLF